MKCGTVETCVRESLSFCPLSAQNCILQINGLSVKSFAGPI